MSAAPDVTVIIPTYNRLGYLPACVGSVLGQRGSLRVEVVVVDDGSTDGTADWVRGHESDIVYVHQQNAGQGAARNRGVELARGEFVVFLDSDDLLADGALDRLVATARQHEADLVAGSWTTFHDGEDPAAGAVSATAHHPARGDRAKVIGVLPVVSAYAFRHRDVAWNESMVVNEGVDWLVRYVARHPCVVCTDAVVTHIRQHEAVDRISVANDHFDPAERLALFDLLLSSLDWHVCREAFIALRRFGALPARPGQPDRLRPRVALGWEQSTALCLLVRLLRLERGAWAYHALYMRARSVYVAAGTWSGRRRNAA